MFLNSMFKYKTNFTKENLLQGIIKYFNYESNYENLDFYKDKSLIKFQEELLKMGFTITLQNKSNIKGEGFCLINISQIEFQNIWIFCEYNTKNNHVKYYDVIKENKYFSTMEVLSQIMSNDLCFVIHNVNKS